MKRLLLLLALGAVVITSCKKDDDNDDSTSTGGSSTSTFSIEASDFGNIGDAYTSSVDSASVDTIDMSANSGSLDLSFLNHPFRTDSTIYVDPADYACASQFPDANLAMKDLNQTVIFLNKSSEKIEIVGVYLKQDTTDIIIPFSDKLTIFNFPLKKESNFSDEGYGETTINISYMGTDIPINIKVNSSVEYSVVGDLLVKSPEGEERCLKELRNTVFKVTLTPDISGQGPSVDTSLTYNYYAKGKGDTFIKAQLNLSDSTNKEISYLNLN